MPSRSGKGKHRGDVGGMGRRAGGMAEKKEAIEGERIAKIQRGPRKIGEMREEREKRKRGELYYYK